MLGSINTKKLTKKERRKKIKNIGDNDTYS